MNKKYYEQRKNLVVIFSYLHLRIYFKTSTSEVNLIFCYFLNMTIDDFTCTQKRNIKHQRVICLININYIKRKFSKFKFEF